VVLCTKFWPSNGRTMNTIFYALKKWLGTLATTPEAEKQRESTGDLKSFHVICNVCQPTVNSIRKNIFLFSLPGVIKGYLCDHRYSNNANLSLIIKSNS